MTITTDFKALGFSETQAKVYVAILTLGEPAIGAIERATSLHKQLIYNAAKQLETMGLITIREVRGKKRFSADHPELLEQRVRDQLDIAQTLVPRLHEMANIERAEEKTRMYRGAAGIQQYYVHSARRQPKNSTVSILGVNSKRYFDLLPTDSIAYTRFENIRIERNVALKLLLAGQKDTERELNERRKLVQLRMLNEKIYGPMDLMIWHDHVGMLFYDAEPYIISLVGKDTVRGFEDYYKALWNMAEESK